MEHQIQVQWRRDKVLEFGSKGQGQPEIARILHVRTGTLNRELSILIQPKENTLSCNYYKK